MSEHATMGTRRFGRWNVRGTYTLAEREVRRFTAVWSQTLAAPLITAGLFLAVFSLAIGPTRGDVMGVDFLTFISPGILMMTVIQNAFANTSSSILVAKVQGNIVDTLMPPLNATELVIGYTAGGMGRGVFVGVAVTLLMIFGIGIEVQHPLWAIVFVLLGSAFMAGLGIIAAIFAEKFDHLAVITNFIITPLSFLSGTFYSIDRLPGPMQTASHLNPIFYLIDGVRYGVIGTSDSSPWLGLAVCVVCTAAVMGACHTLFRRGTRLKP